MSTVVNRRITGLSHGELVGLGGKMRQFWELTRVKMRSIVVAEAKRGNRLFHNLPQ